MENINTTEAEEYYDNENDTDLLDIDPPKRKIVWQAKDFDLLPQKRSG